jgi:hypothetical protein
MYSLILSLTASILNDTSRYPATPLLELGIRARRRTTRRRHVGDGAGTGQGPARKAMVMRTLLNGVLARRKAAIPRIAG